MPSRNVNTAPVGTLTSVLGLDASGNVVTDKSLPSVRTPPLIAGIGSSTIGRGENNSGSGTTRTWGGIGNAMNIMCGGRAYMPQSYNRAVNGVETSAMLSTQLPEVLALSPRPRGCLFIGGANDATAGTSWATTKANIEAIVDALIANGIIPILGTPQAGLGFSTAIQLRYARIANFVRDLARTKKGCILVDPVASFMDKTLATYETLPQFMDGGVAGVHLNHTATQIYGAAIGTALANAGWPPTNTGIVSNGDLFDATENNMGNLVANGMFSGTSGSITGAGLTGTSPTGWSINSSLGGTVVSGVGSDGTGCKLTLSGTVSQNNIVLFRDLSAPELANILSGDTLSLAVAVSSLTATNILCIQAMLRLTISGASVEDLDGGSISTGGPVAPFDGVFRTVPRTITTLPTAARIRLLIFPATAGAWSGEVTFKSAHLFKNVA